MTAPASGVDAGALIAALLATAVALVVYSLGDERPERLARFVPEQVAIFGMTDSTPLRQAGAVFCAMLVLGALALRFLPSVSVRAAVLRPPHATRSALIAAGLLALAVIVVQIAMLRSQPLPIARAPAWVSAVWLTYAAGVGVLAASRRLPASVPFAALGLGVLLVLWPATSGMMTRVSPEMLPWVDLHMAAVFAGGEMLSHGYALFSDVPPSYGIVTPLLLAAVLASGIEVDLHALIRVVQGFQALALGLFLIACWLRTRGAEAVGRATALLLLLLVAAPFLSLGGLAVLHANQSGMRFVMMPVAVLVLLRLSRGDFVATSAIAGATATVALLHNIETGVAITAGLGLAWVLRGCAEERSRVAAAVGAGLAASLAVLLATLTLHRVVLGAWPSPDLLSGAALLGHFASGFGGMQPRPRLVAVVLFCHAGYVVVRALGLILGPRRVSEGPAAADTAGAGIAGIIIAWSPYFANRPHDWNLWVSLVLYVLLIAPSVAAFARRRVWPGLVAVILVVPIPFSMAMTNQRHWSAMAAMSVRDQCVAGLSLPPAVCDEHAARIRELVRLAGPGDVLWATAYPHVTLLASGLRPMAAPFDIFLAVRTEAELDRVAASIASARPTAVLIDGRGSPTPVPVPPLLRALQERVITRAGFAPCDLIRSDRWQVWLSHGACSETSPEVAALRGRLGNG